MSKKLKNNKAEKWLICFLISIPMTFALIKIIENKNKVLFWLYMGIAGVSVIIKRLFEYTDSENKFLKIVEYIALTSAITFFLSVFWLYFFQK